MSRQTRRGISKHIASAFMLGALVMVALTAQSAGAACRGAWAVGIPCDTSWGPPGCGCAAGKEYYGRGPLQISWNGNDCAAGNALGVELKNSPGLVATHATISWRTGFWFWMSRTGAGSMTAHNAIVNGKGFGETIHTINGSLECNGKNPAEMQDRVNRYKNFKNKLGVGPGGNLDC